MKRGSVIVDVAIDQGGSVEMNGATTHADPTYVIDGVVHYMVANMPGAVPRTSTYALNNATLPFTLALADKGWRRALVEDAHLKNGIYYSRRARSRSRRWRKRPTSATHRRMKCAIERVSAAENCLNPLASAAAFAARMLP